MPTFKQLQDDVIERVNGDSTATSSALRTRVKRFINEWYRRILAHPWMAKVRDTGTTVTITLAAGTTDYSLSVAGIRAIYDATNQFPLVERSLGWLRARDPGETSSGNPVAYVIKARTRVAITVSLWPPPATDGGVLKVDGEALTTEMSGDTDYAVIPENFHWLLSEGALYNEYRRMGDMARAQESAVSIGSGERDLRVALNSSGAASLVPGRSRYAASGRSRLGPHFPSDY